MHKPIVLRWSCLALIAGALTAGAMGHRATAAGDPPEQDVQTLKRRLAEQIAINAKLRQGSDDLRRQLSELGDQLTKLEGQLKQAPAKVVVPPLLPPPPDAQPPLPRGSQEQQFNGMPYYLIPLNATGSARPASDRL